MANYYTSSKGITFDMDQAWQRRRTNVDARTGENTYQGRNGSGMNTGATKTSTAASNEGNSMILAYLQALEEKQRQAANAAYNSNVSALNNAYSERSNLLKNNLDSTLQNLQTDYDASKSNINKDASNSLQQAYINNMLSQKNLAQNMAAQGLSGGASETTMAGMYNNYGNARNNIQTVANDNLGNLENLYSQNRNSAYQAYNDQLAQDAITKAQYLAQFEADRQNALATAYNTQLSQLMNLDPTYTANMLGLVNTQSEYTPTATSANNDVKSVSTTQSWNDTVSNGLTNAQRIAYAKKVIANGGDADDIVRGLSYTTDSQTLSDILAQLGLA